ncbi:Disease resistance protein [Camellia lanceoleosa]|uniref:Disease resistance protein n=1 Tax=Camellia lanceoleosa TaxID=1840588 RepID=A0ACC0H498_9ERIC|nr:Disease resistance protein [Camellia lanceoleosa]
MALGIFVTLLMKAGEYLVEPVGQQLRYLFCYNKNVENFHKEVEKLGDTRDSMQQCVEAAKRNGEEIRINIQKWLTNMDGVLAEVEGLGHELNSKKRCFNGLCPDWSSRYKFSKEAIKKTAIVTELQGNVKFGNVSVPVPPPSTEFILSNDLVTFQSTESTIDQIMEALQDDRCDIVGVYGMGGIGKTTLVKEVDLRKIQGQLADLLGLKFSEETEIGRAGRLYERLKKEKGVLIILDDIWSSINLAEVGIPRGKEHKGCKIILTTRQGHVCNTAMGDHMEKVPVRLLSTEESRDLFRKYVGGAVNNAPTLNCVAMEVARECQGLPLALVTIARALRDRDIEEWRTALQQLKKSKSVSIDDTEESVFSCLRLSYEYLRSDEMKLCFLLCCLFPEDHNIQIEDLARYSMEKRCLRDADTMEEARRKTHEIIMHLKASCLLLDSDKEGCVKMHDMVRDLAISIASEENNAFLGRAGVGLKEWPTTKTFDEYKCISLMTNNIKKLPQELKFPKLQILLMGENEGFEELPDACSVLPRFLTRPSSLLPGHDSISSSSLLPRVLTLPPSLQLLVHLRTFNLDRCKLGNIYILGKLKKLEILSFYGSDIKILPREIGELSNLKLLDLSFCQYLQTIPPNVISRLSQLEELYMGGSFHRWAIEGTKGERTNACLSELIPLLQLTVLCVELKNIACFPKGLLLHKLLKFEVTIGHDSIKCYPNSKRLCLREIKAPIPNEVKNQFQSIEELTMFCLEEINIIPDLDIGGLNSLKSLKVISCQSMFSLVNTNECSPPVIFAALEELHLRNLDNVDVICRGSLPTASLQKLRILKAERCCKFVPLILTSELLDMLRSLEEVTIARCEKVVMIFWLPMGEEEHMPLSTLTKLCLEALPSLFSIWNSSKLLARLQNLTVVEIRDCGYIKFIFPHSIAQSLQQLEILKIKGCPFLKRIVQGDQTDHTQAVGFPNLKVLQVEDCTDLTSLFSVTTAQSFRQLKELMIVKCERLVEIISHIKEEEEEEEEEENDEEILLPKVRSFEVRDSSSLKRLCSENFCVNLPTLKELVVDRCPMMGTFAADATAYGLQSASKMMKIQIDGQTLSATAFQKIFSGKVWIFLVSSSFLLGFNSKAYFFSRILD